MFQEQKLMGMSVIGICNKKISFSHYQGWADWQRKIPIDSHTKYRVASVSKVVTSIALMQLWEKGLFQLDDDINSYLGFSVRNPLFPDVAITFRMLLSHTSSIADGSGYEPFLAATFQKDASPPSISHLFATNGIYYHPSMFLDKKPGSFFNYSNAAYGLVGTLIEKISKVRFDIYCRQNIFIPLGLDASFNVQDLKNIDNLAVLYKKKEKEWVAQADDYNGLMPSSKNLDSYVIGSNGLLFSPQGGLRISAKDLAVLALVMLQKGEYQQKQILKSKTLTMMLAPQWRFNGKNGNSYDGLFRAWGLGLHISTLTPQYDVVFTNNPMIGHPGEAYGLLSDWYFNVQTGEAVIFITNGSEKPYTVGKKSAFYLPEEICFSIVQKVLRDRCNNKRKK
jgi:CubicO group peptidase (beta-lactamase class C family)